MLQVFWYLLEGVTYGQYTVKPNNQHSNEFAKLFSHRLFWLSNLNLNFATMPFKENSQDFHSRVDTFVWFSIRGWPVKRTIDL